MEENKDRNKILDLIWQPAFCVRDGMICHVNQAASQLFIEPGQPVAKLLGEDAGEYEQFRDGSLYLTLRLEGLTAAASITRMEDCDIFMVEPEGDQVELRVLALAAMRFREPLSGVNALIDRLLPSEQDADDPHIRKYLGELDRQLFQLQRLVCNMSDAARYATETERKLVCVDICATVAELFGRVEALTCGSGISLRWSCPQEQILTLIDPEKLERAVYNMISNAIRATGKDGVIEAKLLRRGDRMYVSVRDYGVGIPDRIMGSVFTRFRRHPGLEDARDGIGLGLPLICSAATVHGGTVLIDRPEGGGARITMSLAIRQSDGTAFRSNVPRFDYAGEKDHGLLELSDALPTEAYI